MTKLTKSHHSCIRHVKTNKTNLYLKGHKNELLTEHVVLLLEYINDLLNLVNEYAIVVLRLLSKCFV